MKKLCAIIGTKVLFSMVMVSFLYADDAALLSRAFPIVKSSLKPSAYKRILMTDCVINIVHEHYFARLLMH